MAIKDIVAAARQEGLWLYWPKTKAYEMPVGDYTPEPGAILIDPRVLLTREKKAADLAADRARRVEQDYQVWKARRRK